VDTLTTRKDLFITDGDVVGVGKLRVLRIRHGVEGASTRGESVCWNWIRTNSRESGKSHLPRME